MNPTNNGLSTVEALLRQLIQSLNGLTNAVAQASANSVQATFSANSPTATAGTETLPAQPAGFIPITTTSGAIRKIPYYGD